MTHPSSIIEWEITKEEWRNRYARYIPIIIPSIILLNISVLVLLWTKNFLVPGAVLLGICYVLIIAYIVWDYSTLPHRYRLTQEGITVIRQQKSHTYRWEDFAGYTIGQEYTKESRSAFRRKGVGIDEKQMKSIMDSSQSIFGSIYQLIRPWGRWTFIPVWGSIFVVAEPEVEERVREVITKHLKRISANRLENATNGIWIFILAVVLVGVLMMVAQWSQPVPFITAR